ncbi:interferon regulatory factor 1-like isoform X2 [Scomber scombrus]|uniref:Interferon regulatory factor 1-like isoform X2 n=1 Tax=Scomber scombrus TaxID=13677 RepID=A0AAV1QB43_SCOSC
MEEDMDYSDYETSSSQENTVDSTADTEQKHNELDNLPQYTTLGTDLGSTPADVFWNNFYPQTAFGLQGV